jgi:hypothetical protein
MSVPMFATLKSCVSTASPLRYMHVMQHIRRFMDESGVDWSYDLI